VTAEEMTAAVDRIVKLAHALTQLKEQLARCEGVTAHTRAVLASAQAAHRRAEDDEEAARAALVAALCAAPDAAPPPADVPPVLSPERATSPAQHQVDERDTKPEHVSAADPDGPVTITVLEEDLDRLIADKAVADAICWTGEETEIEWLSAGNEFGYRQGRPVVASDAVDGDDLARIRRVLGRAGIWWVEAIPGPGGKVLREIEAAPRKPHADGPAEAARPAKNARKPRPSECWTVWTRLLHGGEREAFKGTKTDAEKRYRELEAAGVDEGERIELRTPKGDMLVYVETPVSKEPPPEAPYLPGVVFSISREDYDRHHDGSHRDEPSLHGPQEHGPGLAWDDDETGTRKVSGVVIPPARIAAVRAVLARDGIAAEEHPFAAPAPSSTHVALSVRYAAWHTLDKRAQARLENPLPSAAPKKKRASHEAPEVDFSAGEWPNSSDEAYGASVISCAPIPREDARVAAVQAVAADLGIGLRVQAAPVWTCLRCHREHLAGSGDRVTLTHYGELACGGLCPACDDEIDANRQKLAEAAKQRAAEKEAKKSAKQAERAATKPAATKRERTPKETPALIPPPATERPWRIEARRAGSDVWEDLGPAADALDAREGFDLALRGSDPGDHVRLLQPDGVVAREETVVTADAGGALESRVVEVTPAESAPDDAVPADDAAPEDLAVDTFRRAIREAWGVAALRAVSEAFRTAFTAGTITQEQWFRLCDEHDARLHKIPLARRNGETKLLDAPDFGALCDAWHQFVPTLDVSVFDLERLRAIFEARAAELRPATPDVDDSPDELVRTARHDHVVVAREPGRPWERIADTVTKAGALTAYKGALRKHARAKGAEARRFEKRLPKDAWVSSGDVPKRASKPAGAAAESAGGAL